MNRSLTVSDLVLQTVMEALKNLAGVTHEQSARPVGLSVTWLPVLLFPFRSSSPYTSTGTFRAVHDQEPGLTP